MASASAVNLSGTDMALWLHNRLGSSEAWTNGSLGGQMNAQTLCQIKDCFSELQTPVKLKLLLSFLRISRRIVEELRSELNEIIEVAEADSERWVSMLAKFMKNYPTTMNLLNMEINQEADENQWMFADLVKELKNDFGLAKGLNLLPLESHFFNKSVFKQVLGPRAQKPLVKHFKLTNSTKVADLRAKLLLKSEEAAMHSAKKIPFRTPEISRKMNDTTPLKGLPSYDPLGFVPSSTWNTTRPVTGKQGGIKVLGINEQPLPIGLSQLKKKKKDKDREEAKKATE